MVEAEGTRYVGLEQASGVQAFLGIPFAEPPVNDLRWERPVPIKGSLGEVNATQFMPACMQTGSGLAWYHGMMSRVGVDPSLMEGPEYSEDCLYLNVWTDSDYSEPKPVLVFIHGGSNTGGWSYEPNYHGSALAERGVVVVTVAYRLGVFGWLSHPDMTIQNAGLHDLIVALEWVKRNIEAFGGDSDRVVVSGESAGADNALHLALAPAMAGKLAGVIHQSAGWSVTSTLKPEGGFALGEALVAHHLGADGSFADLKQISAAELLEAQLELFSDHYFSPIPDPETLPVSLQETMVGDLFPALTLILGSNRNESLMYIPEDAVLTNYLEGYFPPETWDDIKVMLGADLSELAQMDRLRSAVQYTCPSLALAQAAQDAGGAAYVYRFDRVREDFDAIGAYHGAELPYVFDTHDAWIPTDVVDYQITNALVDYWVAFLTNGSPNESESGDTEIGRMIWPAWTQKQQALIVSDEVSAQTHPDAALCDFLNATQVASARH
jgi:para-nitrobenzyl esterase